MGSDIHGHMEYREVPGSEWELVGDIAPLGELLSQSYKMFANLFGVRTYRLTMPFSIVEPDRGFPVDTARPEMLGWKADPAGGDIHSFTYITGEELLPWLHLLDSQADSTWSTFFRIMRNMSESIGPKNVRAVIFFDS